MVLLVAYVGISVVALPINLIRDSKPINYQGKNIVTTYTAGYIDRYNIYHIQIDTYLLYIYLK
jgi:hypothetical protein